MSNDTVYGFTKIVVDDLDRMADFYQQVFGYRQLQRVHAAVAGEPIEEIILVQGEGYGQGLPLIVWKWTQRPAPAASDAILGFQSGDVDALVARVVAAGGTVVDPPHDQAQHGVRVAFARDPDGRYLELVQMLGTAAG
jgi:predicted enzyme related to lactoylglutathione lyase